MLHNVNSMSELIGRLSEAAGSVGIALQLQPLPIVGIDVSEELLIIFRHCGPIFCRFG